jgi:hypothetical protein
MIAGTQVHGSPTAQRKRLRQHGPPRPGPGARTAQGLAVALPCPCRGPALPVLPRPRPDSLPLQTFRWMPPQGGIGYKGFKSCLWFAGTNFSAPDFRYRRIGEHQRWTHRSGAGRAGLHRQGGERGLRPTRNSRESRGLPTPVLTRNHAAPTTPRLKSPLVWGVVRC